MDDPGVVVAPFDGDRGADPDCSIELGREFFRDADAAVGGGGAGAWDMAGMHADSGSREA